MKQPSLLLVGLLLLAGCQSGALSDPASTSGMKVTTVHLLSPAGQSVPVTVEMAQTNAQQEMGLMGRDRLDDGKGMLFEFPTQQRLLFWMKNTLIPLDIIFVDNLDKVILTRTMEPCTQDPCATYDSGGPAIRAIEVPKGFVATHGVGSGWTLQR